MQLRLTHAQRRQQVHHVAQGTDVHPLLEAVALQFFADRVEVAAAAGIQLEGSNGALAAHVFHQGMQGQLFEERDVARIELLIALRVVLQQIKAG